MKLATQLAFLGLLMPLVIVGCGLRIFDVKKRYDTPNKHVTDETFRDNISTFESYRSNIVTTPIIFDDNMSDSIGGVCTKWLRSKKIVYREITINTEYWDSISEAQQQQLIDHELGHCELNRGHNDEKLENDQPASIMNSYVFGLNEIRYMELNLDYYIDELFN